MPKANKKEAPSFAYLIEKKRDGGEYTDEEVRTIVDAILDEEMPRISADGVDYDQFLQGHVCRNLIPC